MDTSALRGKMLLERDLDVGFMPDASVEAVLDRRMAERGIGDADAYLDLLDADPDEYTLFLRSLLTRPDRFFADPELTSLLRADILPSLMQREPDQPIRIWVVQCGLGYLAYEAAALLYQLTDGSMSDAKVFATDSDGSPVLIARRQDYPADRFDELRARGIPLALDRRGPRLDPRVRGPLIFGVNDPVTQPPFQRMNLILCVGYLPLLDQTTRGRVKSKLVYGLAQGGALVLGRGEVLGLDEDAPRPDRPFPIFHKRIATLATQRRDIAQVASGDVSAILNSYRVPVLLLSCSGKIAIANEAATSAWSPSSALDGLSLEQALPVDLAKLIAGAAERCRNTEDICLIGATAEWTGAVAPLIDAESAPYCMAVVLMPVGIGEGNGSASLEVRHEISIQMAESARAAINAQTEATKLRQQAAAITDTLYTTSEILARTTEDLKSRNFELEIVNQELRRAVIDREEAEQTTRQAYDRELHISKTLQDALLLTVPSRMNGYSFDVKYQAAFDEAEVGGDFYHATTLPCGRLLVFIGDVSGKGLEAAVYAFMAKYMLLGFASENPDPASVLRRLSAALHGYSGYGWFVTLVYALIDPHSHTLSYCNAGHEPAVFVRAQHEMVELLHCPGPALGLRPDDVYPSNTVTMDPGDVFIAYTDGISEAGYREERDLQARGVARLVAENLAQGPGEILDILQKTATDLAGGRLNDDACTIAVKRVE